MFEESRTGVQRRKTVIWRAHRGKVSGSGREAESRGSNRDMVTNDDKS